MTLSAILAVIGGVLAVVALIFAKYAREDERFPPQEEGEPSGWPLVFATAVLSAGFFGAAWLAS